MDGSAASFVYLIRTAGIFRQREPRPIVRIRRKIEVRDGDRTISIEPASEFRIHYGISFDHPSIGRQTLDLFGGLALLGAPAAGYVRVERGGHALHQKLVAAIIANPNRWRIDHAECEVADALGLTSFARA